MTARTVFFSKKECDLMKSFHVECLQCQCPFHSLVIDLASSKLLASCEMCERKTEFGISEFGIRVLQKKAQEQKQLQ